MDTRKIRALLVVAVLALGALSFVPAPAAGGSVCEILGTVTLTTVENLAFVDGGTGTLSPSPIVCAGTPVVGTGTIQGTFAFCKHSGSAAANHGSQCSGIVDWNGDHVKNSADTPPPMANGNEEALYNGLGANTPIVAHVVASFSFTMGANNCSFDLNGHTIGVQANLELRNFQCNGTPYPTARAEAIAGLRVDPTIMTCAGTPKLCFQEVVFEGVQLMAQ